MLVLFQEGVANNISYDNDSNSNINIVKYKVAQPLTRLSLNQYHLHSIQAECHILIKEKKKVR